jgi:hypothetical protein
MAKDLKEQIEIMTYYLNGGEIEFKEQDTNNAEWVLISVPHWNWEMIDYRIKEQKQKVTIEKWLLKDSSNGEYFIYDSSRIDLYIKETINSEKVKLLKVYEIEL